MYSNEIIMQLQPQSLFICVYKPADIDTASVHRKSVTLNQMP